MSFSDLPLNSILIKNLNKLGYKTPTPVQSKIIPLVLNGNDLRVSAPTGTGKTAAFLLPSITKMLNNPSTTKEKGPKILVLVPTRELALQVATQAKKYSRNVPKVNTVCIYGGAPYNVQLRELRRPHEIIVATPGRLIDLMDRKKICFNRIETFILDEADRMLDMGFSEPVKQIANSLPTNHQTLLLSATLKGNVLDLSAKLLKNPLEINILEKAQNHKNIDQRLLMVDNIQHKQKILDHLLKDPKINQAIIFTSTKKQANLLSEKLIDSNFSACALHGDMNQRQRTKTIKQLRNNQFSIMVATDVAARGIDIDTISHVINFDMPSTEDDYIHRIGRTGRAGKTGLSFSFATNSQKSFVRSIEKLTGKKMIEDIIEGLEPKKKDSGNSCSKNNKNKNKKFGRNRNKNSNSSKPSARKRFSKRNKEKSFVKRKR